jgi:hypothetical protein
MGIVGALSRLTLFAVVASGLSGCGEEFKVSDDCECGFYTNAVNKDILHWPDNGAIRFEFAKDFPQVFRPSVVSATRTYNSVLAKTSIELDANNSRAPAFTGDPKRVSGDGINGIYWVTGTWPWPDSPDTDGMTITIFSPDGILEADVFLRADSLTRPHPAGAHAAIAPAGNIDTFYGDIPV